MQAGTAGVDGLICQGLRERDVLLTNARGAHGIPMAENILTMALCFATRMHLMIRSQRTRGRIGRQVIRDKWELHGQTMLVLGLGDIGALGPKGPCPGDARPGVRAPDGHTSTATLCTGQRGSRRHSRRPITWPSVYP